MNASKKLFSLNEAAELLGINRTTVLRWVTSGKLKAARVGRSYVISVEDLPHHLIGGLSEEKKNMIRDAVKRALDEYGETFRALARE